MLNETKEQITEQMNSKFQMMLVAIINQDYVKNLLIYIIMLLTLEKDQVKCKLLMKHHHEKI